MIKIQGQISKCISKVGDFNTSFLNIDWSSIKVFSKDEDLNSTVNKFDLMNIEFFIQQRQSAILFFFSITHETVKKLD